MAFYLSKDTFNCIPISVATHLKSEPEPRQCSFEMVSIIDQNRCLGDRHVLLQFLQKQHSKLRRFGRKEPKVEEFVGLGIDGRVKPAPLVIYLNHRLINCDVIRRRIAGRLQIGILHLIMDDHSTPSDTQLFKILFGIRK